MFLTKSEHSKIVENFSNAFENTKAIMLTLYEPKVLFSHCDLSSADTPLEKESGTPHWICSSGGLMTLRI